MRRAARTDANHAEVVKRLRELGCTVQDLSRVGEGVPDLLVGVRGRNMLVEIKDGSKPPSRRKLTPDQERWHRRWLGPIRIVETLDDCLQLVKELAND